MSAIKVEGLDFPSKDDGQFLLHLTSTHWKDHLFIFLTQAFTLLSSVAADIRYGMLLKDAGSISSKEKKDIGNNSQQLQCKSSVREWDL